MSNEVRDPLSVLDINFIKSIIISNVTSLSILKWDLGASSSVNISAQVDKGEPKQLKGSQSTALTLRVWNEQGQIGIATTSDLTRQGIEQSMSKALEASYFGNKEEIPQFSPLAKEKLITLPRMSLKETPEINILIKLLKTAESALLNSNRHINSIPYNGISHAYIKRIYLNSEEANREFVGSIASIYLYARAERKNQKPRSSGSVKISKDLFNLDIKGCIKEASEKTINHLNYKSLKTGKYLVCFMPEAFLELFSAFSNIFNARSVIDGISLSNKESIGTKISSHLLSVYDDNLHPANIGACNFDGEGTPTKKITLIENGILKNFLHSEATARIFGVDPTGHASIGAKASVSPDWLVITKSSKFNKEAQELNHNSAKETYILIENLSALHVGVKASQGSFSLPFDGWIVKNGNRISVEAGTIAGDIKQLLNSIISIEGNSINTHIGVSPYVWVKELSVTGEA